MEKSSLEVIPQILSATLSEWGRPHALSHPVNQPRHPGFNMSPGGWRLKTTHNIFLKETFARKWAQRWRKPSKTQVILWPRSDQTSKENAHTFSMEKSSYQLSHTRFHHKSPVVSRRAKEREARRTSSFFDSAKKAAKRARTSPASSFFSLFYAPPVSTLSTVWRATMEGLGKRVQAHQGFKI